MVVVTRETTVMEILLTFWCIVSAMGWFVGVWLYVTVPAAEQKITSKETIIRAGFFFWAFSAICSVVILL